MDSELNAPPRLPLVPLNRRIAAFALDFGAAALLSTLGGGVLYVPFFLLSWFSLRVILVLRNRGQSLGRWAFDMRVLDFKTRSLPSFTTLVKRESITGVGCLLLLLGLVNLSPANAWVLVTPVPLLANCALAFSDDGLRQAFHDRLCRTVVAQTRRGYSLDLKIKRLFAEAQRRVK
jgi:uncharacterized RDD family membrane protein YckC